MAGESQYSPQLADHLFRHESGKMVAILTRIFGLENMDMAEDIVQDAFARAVEEWPFRFPENPSAWLMQVAKNRAIDLIRQNRMRREKQKQMEPLLQSEYTIRPAIDKIFLDHEIRDSQLRMIFACCHPALAESDQIALTLKTCSGFSVQEIARALLTQPETVKKRIQRARQFIAENNVKFEIPTGDALTRRLDTTLQVLYLLFNEGYNSHSKEELIRKDLCLEAMRLALLLTEHDYLRRSRCYALVALMCLLSARFEARISSRGEIILLEDQDRSLWNTELIRIGMNYLLKATDDEHFSEYHYQATIVAEHSRAASFADTNWENILQLYNALALQYPSPTVEANRAVVIGKLHGPEQAIAAMMRIPGIEKLLETQYLFPALLGDLYRQHKEYTHAITLLERARDLTSSEPEKQLLNRKIAAIRHLLS